MAPLISSFFAILKGIKMKEYIFEKIIIISNINIKVEWGWKENPLDSSEFISSSLEASIIVWVNPNFS